MEVALALAFIAVIVFAALHFSRRKNDDGPGSSGTTGGSNRPGTNHK